jgi:hypothetical protein
MLDWLTGPNSWMAYAAIWTFAGIFVIAFITAVFMATSPGPEPKAATPEPAAPLKAAMKGHDERAAEEPHVWESAASTGEFSIRRIQDEARQRQLATVAAHNQQVVNPWAIQNGNGPKHAPR